MLSLTEPNDADMVSEGFKQDYAGFLQSRRSQITAAVYDTGIKVILGETKPDAFLEYARANPKAAETKLIGWTFKFRDTTGRYGKKPTGATIHAYLASMKSFLEFCDVHLNWKRIIAVCPNPRKKSKKRGYEIEEIRKMYEFLDPRGKFAVHFYNSTGARAAAIDDPRPLTVGDIRRLELDLDGKKVSIAWLKVYGEDDNSEYISYLSDEALEALDQYLDYRRNFGEVITPESPLFRLELDLREAKKDPAKQEKKLKIRAATTEAIKGQIAKALTAAGLNVRNFKMVHGFRHRYKTVLENSPLKSLYVEALLGHVTNEDDPDGYLKADPEVFGQQFARVMSLLYISEGRTAKIRINELEVEKDVEIAKLHARLDKDHELMQQILAKLEASEAERAKGN